MKKLLLLSSFCLLVLLQTLPSYAQAAAPKEYLIIYCNSLHSTITISDSNGNFKEIPYEKKKGLGDQTQMLKLIKEYESAGYRLFKYDYEHPASSRHHVYNIVLEKE